MGRKMNFRPIDQDIFRQRIQDNFSSGYLTLVSIIQGVALGIWITNVSDSFDIDSVEIFQLFYPVISLLSIVFIFYYYSWFVSIVYTPPDFRESAIPIILAVSQIAPMYYFSEPNYWWLFSGIFYFFSSVAFGNTLLTIKDNIYAPDFQPLVPMLKKESLINLILCLSMAILSCCSWITYPDEYDYSYELPLHDWIFLALLLVLISIMALKTQFWFLRKMYLLSGLQIK